MGCIALFCLLAVVSVLLLIKVLLMRRAAREILSELSDRPETNTLIGISSRDGAMRALADGLNDQLSRLRAERHRYQQGDRELKEAITAVAHDLRTPLTSISGYLALLGREPLTEDARRYASLIEERVKALTGLTEELFRYSVVTSVRELAPERIDLRAALENSLVSFYAAIITRGIEPSIELPEESVIRVLDAEAVNRIFANILGNAIKYSDGDLNVRMDGAGTICFSNKAEGLNSVDVGRLFDRFYTVETGGGSTGLGLSIARHLTEHMGGSIAADYAAGRLSITVSFPEGWDKMEQRWDPNPSIGAKR